MRASGTRSPIGCAREHGACHGLVNNAGITMRSRLGEVSLADWNRTLAINATGPMLGMQALMDLMSSGSSIVNIASIAALTGHFAIPYTASKWALRGLSRAASLELGPRGIRVNAVMPGLMATAMTSDVPQGVSDALLGSVPLARAATTGDVAAIVLFLLGEESSYLSGLEIPVDGGQMAHGGMKVLSDAVRDAASARGLTRRLETSLRPIGFLAVGGQERDSGCFSLRPARGRCRSIFS